MASLNIFSNPENPFPTIWKCPVSRKVFFAFVFETDFLDSRKSFISIFLFLWLFVWLILSVFFSLSLNLWLVVCYSLFAFCFFPQVSILLLLFVTLSLFPSITICYSFLVTIFDCLLFVTSFMPFRFSSLFLSLHLSLYLFLSLSVFLSNIVLEKNYFL